MEILIDESGTFASKGANVNSWCTIAAYASPETEKRKYKKILSMLKRKLGKSVACEIKLHEIDEESYFHFLIELGKLKGVLFCVATDSYLNTETLVNEHKNSQVTSILENVDRMIYKGGKSATRLLSSQIDNLSPQIYIQLICQIHLMLSFVNRGIGYFVQRNPNSLREFRWRIDQKEPAKKLDYEYVFEKFSPALLQSLSINTPGLGLSWCDYRPMKEYLYEAGEGPGYLDEKFPELKKERSLDIQKIVRKNIEFVDSESSVGVQISDLLASGVRRLLKAGFNNNEVAAKLLGNLMVQEQENKSPISLITLGNEQQLEESQSKLVRILISSCRSMLK